MSTLHVLFRHTLHPFLFSFSFFGDEYGFYYQLLLLNQKLRHIYTPFSTTANTCHNPLYLGIHKFTIHTKQHNCFFFFLFSMKTIATSSHIHYQLLANIYQIKIGKGFASWAHTTHLRESRERIEMRFQIREGLNQKRKSLICYIAIRVFFLFRFVICLKVFFWDNQTKGQVGYFFYLGQFVNFFGERGQVYKFWDHI